MRSASPDRVRYDKSLIVALDDYKPNYGLVAADG